MPRKPRKKKKKAEVVIQLDNRFRVSPRMVFTLLLFFLGSMGLALTFALTTETRHEINEAYALLQTKRDDNQALRSEVTEKYTLDEIERIAVERLGMNKPDSSQIIHIYVPKQSYSELSVSEEPEQESIIETIVTFFQNLVTY